MSIQEEIHKAMRELQTKADRNEKFESKDLSLMFLTALIEEEAENVDS